VKADLHRNYVVGIERGERYVGLRNIVKLARAIGLTTSELIKWRLGLAGGSVLFATYVLD
jgi:helix-turn-helix protein